MGSRYFSWARFCGGDEVATTTSMAETGCSGARGGSCRRTRSDQAVSRGCPPAWCCDCDCNRNSNCNSKCHRWRRGCHSYSFLTSRLAAAEVRGQFKVTPKFSAVGWPRLGSGCHLSPSTKIPLPSPPSFRAVSFHALSHCPPPTPAESRRRSILLEHVSPACTSMTLQSLISDDLGAMAVGGWRSWPRWNAHH